MVELFRSFGCFYFGEVPFAVEADPLLSLSVGARVFIARNGIHHGYPPFTVLVVVTIISVFGVFVNRGEKLYFRS